MRLPGQTVVAVILLLFSSEALAQKGKPVVAIYEMTDLAKTGMSDTFSTMISTAITTTQKFRVIERRFAVLDREQANARGGRVTTNQPGKTGGFEGADFLIYGSITTVSS